TSAHTLVRHGTQYSLAFGSSVLTSGLREPPGSTAEHGSRGEARASGIVPREEPAEHLAAHEQPRYRLAGAVQHAPVKVRLETAEGEGDPAGHRVRGVRRHGERVGPVALRRVDGSEAAILDRRVELARGVDRG